MRIAVLFAKDSMSAPDWIPDAWPYIVKQLKDGCRDLPDSRWVLMKKEDLVKHKARWQEVYDLAAAENVESQDWKDPDLVE